MLSYQIAQEIRFKGKATRALLPRAVADALEASIGPRARRFTLEVVKAPYRLYLDESHDYQIFRADAHGIYVPSNRVGMASNDNAGNGSRTSTLINTNVGQELPLEVADYVVDRDRSYGPFHTTLVLVAHPNAEYTSLDALLTTNGWGTAPATRRTPVPALPPARK